jgi:hypothetical protein
MVKKQSPKPSRKVMGYPMRIRSKDMEITQGDLMIVGRPAEYVRRLVVNHPELYPEIVVPYLQEREPSFKANELWIDTQGRVHIANKKLLARARHHMKQAKPAARRTK